MKPAGGRSRAALLATTTVLILATLLGLSGFAIAEIPKIDGKTKETFDRSVKAMADTLSDEDKKIFGEGLLNLILTEYPPARGMIGFALLSIMPQAIDAAPVTMNGKTLDEIMVRGRQVAREKGIGAGTDTSAKSEVQQRRECIQRLVLMSGAVIERGSGFPHISVQVTNKLSWPISGVHVGYKVRSPGRPIPWADENFAIGVAGGIQPGETRKVSTTAMLPADMPRDISVEATILDAADQDKALFVGDTKIMGWAESRSDRVCQN